MTPGVQLVDHLDQRGRRLLVVAGHLADLADAREEGSSFVVVGGDLERSLEVGQRLLGRPERKRAICGAPQCNTCLRSQGLSLGTRRSGPVCVHVVACENAGQFLVAHCLEVTSRCQVASAAIALRQRSVRDLPDERLNELVLTPLRRPRINL